MAMTIGDLKKQLEQYDDNDVVVVMSKDGEGNNFSPLSDIEEKIYVPNSTWSGDVYPIEITKEMIDEGWEEDDDQHNNPEAKKAIVLWPVN